jgi:TrmH family RNA methyltransferase
MVVEHVEKPGNLGAILRTVDAAGIEALFVSDAATDVFNPNVIRASLGTAFSVAVIPEKPENILSFLKKTQN